MNGLDRLGHGLLWAAIGGLSGVAVAFIHRRPPPKRSRLLESYHRILGRHLYAIALVDVLIATVGLAMILTSEI